MTTNHDLRDGLREVLAYCPFTGAFVWRVRRGCVSAGTMAGNISPKGYVYIEVFGRRYLAHRLAVFYVTGAWPKGEVDHRDGVRNNNRWLNLRPATTAQNRANSMLRTNNKSGYKGVNYDRRRGKWRAQVRFHGAQKHLGYFATPQEAHEIYCASAKILHGVFFNSGAAV